MGQLHHMGQLGRVGEVDHTILIIIYIIFFFDNIYKQNNIMLKLFILIKLLNNNTMTHWENTIINQCMPGIGNLIQQNKNN